MGLWNFLTGNGNPTRKWLASDEPLPVIRFNPFALGKLRLGEELESIRFLGCADEFTGKAKSGNMTLTYLRYGLQVIFEDHRVAQVTFHAAGGTFWALGDAATAAKLHFADGTKLDERSTVDDVRNRFGEPDEKDQNEDQVSLTYRDGREWQDFEFNDAGVLGAWAVWVED